MHWLSPLIIVACVVPLTNTANVKGPTGLSDVLQYTIYSKIVMFTLLMTGGDHVAYRAVGLMGDNTKFVGEDETGEKTEHGS